MKKLNILVVVGTRPDAIKMAPVCFALKQNPAFKTILLATAQHRQMLDQVLSAFHLTSDYDFNIMEESQTLFHVTRETLSQMESLLKKITVDLILVHGDTTTACAAALAAFYRRIPIGHVEAGLRTFDINNPYPEEANRVIVDDLAELHFAPTKLAAQNLRQKKISSGHIYITGNTVIDALYHIVAGQSKQCISSKRMILMTAHRRENFGKPLKDICSAVQRIAHEFHDVEIVYPVHLNPSVYKPVHQMLGKIKNVRLIKPVDYITMTQLINKSYCVVTDSGGLQEEAPSLGKPVIVLRKVTERPEAVEAGTVRIAGVSTDIIYREIKALLTNKKRYHAMSHAVNPYGDGNAAPRIVHAIKYWAGMSKTRPKDFKA